MAAAAQDGKPQPGTKPEETKPPALMTVELDRATAWQPRGGHVLIIVQSNRPDVLPEAKLTAQFRWSGHGEATPYWSAPLDLVEQKAGKAIYRVSVPDREFPELKSSWFDRIGSQLFSSIEAVPGRFEALQTVPVADLLIKIVTPPPRAGAEPVITETSVRVGITSAWNARIIAVLAVLLSIATFSWWARKQAVPGDGFLLPLISTRRGYASLSQFQIMLWSFLLGAGAIYVMVLAGSLIDIPARALVLLGIAGGTTVLSKVQSVNSDNKPSAAPPPPTAAPGPVGNVTALRPSDTSVALTWTPPAANPAATVAQYRIEHRPSGAPANAAWTGVVAPASVTVFQVTGLTAATAYDFRVFAVNAIGDSLASATLAVTTQPTPVDQALPVRKPLWSDLVITPSHPGEIDVTRVQMLFFTLISAGFVAMQLFNSYTIPDIPDGFMLLMGISNGVYLSAKFVQD